MKRILLTIFSFFILFCLKAQTPLTEAVDFHVKTIEGDSYYLFPLLDAGNIVVIDFFSTTCGPCQQYAPDFQQAYEEFGENQSNVFFMGINWGNDNDEVYEFDSIYGLTLPSVSGTQGGGNYAFQDFQILSYPTVIIITPDHQIVNQYIYPPTADSIINAVLDAGGLYLGINQSKKTSSDINVVPNPVTSRAQLTLHLDTDSDVHYELIDLTGIIRFSSGKKHFKAGINQIPLPVARLENGIYFVRTTINGQPVDVKRMVISR